MYPQTLLTMISLSISNQWQKLAFCAAIIMCIGSFSANAQTVTTDKLDYYPGDTVFFQGYDWQAGETVQMVLDIYPATLPNDTIYVVADSTGYFYHDQYIIQPAHLGQAFELNATGLSSGLLSQTF